MIMILREAHFPKFSYFILFCSIVHDILLLMRNLEIMIIFRNMVEYKCTHVQVVYGRAEMLRK